MRDYYLLLTGAYNNVGDFLIVDRAKKLLKKYRPDRDVFEVSRKTELDSDILDRANNAQAVLITGGPALRKNIWPKMIRLSDDLARIKSPILMYGVGWKNRNNSWREASAFRFSDGTRRLLKKIDDSGYPSSLRDYTALAICEWNGFRNFQVTGCPGMYNESGTPDSVTLPEKVGSILLSPGVSYLKDNADYQGLLHIADKIGRYFPDVSIKAVFHHSINSEILSTEYGPGSPHVKYHDKTLKLIEGFRQRGVETFDVSSDLELFTKVYREADAHIGYRVHGHIYTISAGKPSVLISEDSRGMGFKQIIGGPIIDASKSSLPENRIGRLSARFLKENDNSALLKAAAYMLYTELSGKSVHTAVSLEAIRLWEAHMKRFLMSLP